MLFQSLATVFAAINLAAAAPAENFKRQSGALSSTGAAKLQALNVMTGVNAASAGSQSVWIGGGGPYTVDYTNNFSGEVVLVLWSDASGYGASFVGSSQPLITISLEQGQSTTLSFASDTSGAWAGVYPDTVMTSDGQISNTWGEFTMSDWTTVDVSKEVNTQGNTLSISGQGCTANMEQCYFTCTNGATICGAAGTYELMNCAIGSQTNANTGDDNTSGGCTWQDASTMSFTSTFS